MIKTKCIKSCVAATGCCWLLFGWFVASIFDHYSFVYRMCLTIKKGTQKEVFSSLLVVVAQGIIEPPNSENIQEAKRIKKPSKIPSRLKPPENLINLISACVHRLNSFDLRFPSRERNSSSFPFSRLTTHSRRRGQIQLIARVAWCNYSQCTRTHTTSIKFFQFFRVHSAHCVLSPQKLFVPGTDHHLRQLLNNFFNLFFHMFHVRLALNVWWCGRDRKRDRAHTDSESSLGIFFMAKASVSSWKSGFEGILMALGLFYLCLSILRCKICNFDLIHI